MVSPEPPRSLPTNGTVTLTRDRQQSNVKLLITVTLSGMVMLVKLVQYWNALL